MMDQAPIKTALRRSRRETQHRCVKCGRKTETKRITSPVETMTLNLRFHSAKRVTRS